MARSWNKLEKRWFKWGKENQPGPDGLSASGWYGRLCELISSLSVINSDQLQQQSVHVWYLLEKFAPSSRYSWITVNPRRGLRFEFQCTYLKIWSFRTPTLIFSTGKFYNHGLLPSPSSSFKSDKVYLCFLSWWRGSLAMIRLKYSCTWVHILSMDFFVKKIFNTQFFLLGFIIGSRHTWVRLSPSWHEKKEWPNTCTHTQEETHAKKQWTQTLATTKEHKTKNQKWINRGKEGKETKRNKKKQKGGGGLRTGFAADSGQIR